MHSGPPPEFFCPITQELMSDPVLLFDSGQTYERAAILGWLYRGNRTDPLTGQALRRIEVAPNWALKGLISSYLAAPTTNVAAPQPSSPHTTQELASAPPHLITRAASAATSPSPDDFPIAPAPSSSSAATDTPFPTLQELLTAAAEDDVDTALRILQFLSPPQPDPFMPTLPSPPYTSTLPTPAPTDVTPDSPASTHPSLYHLNLIPLSQALFHFARAPLSTLVTACDRSTTRRGAPLA